MVAKCNNPSCSAEFRYLHEGKLFRLDLEPTARCREPRVEYFWLCGHCSARMTLSLRLDGEVAVTARETVHQDNRLRRASWHANGRLLVNIDFLGADGRVLTEEV